MDEIQSEKIARFIGLICHFVYWTVFGHLNQLPLDTYHKKQVFISIAQIQADIEARYATKKVFSTFIMPMILLAIRIEVELIFKNQFTVFFDEPRHDKVRALRDARLP